MSDTRSVKQIIITAIKNEMVLGAMAPPSVTSEMKVERIAQSVIDYLGDAGLKITKPRQRR